MQEKQKYRVPPLQLRREGALNRLPPSNYLRTQRICSRSHGINSTWQFNSLVARAGRRHLLHHSNIWIRDSPWRPMLCTLHVRPCIHSGCLTCEKSAPRHELAAAVRSKHVLSPVVIRHWHACISSLLFRVPDSDRSDCESVPTRRALMARWGSVRPFCCSLVLLM